MIIYAAIILLVLLFLKVPVFISVLSASAIYFLGNPTINATVFAQQTLAGAQGLSLLAIPFFVMAGVFMNSSVHTDGRPVRIFSGRCSYGM